jgi:agmatine/peptidylarginine deiminase
VLGEWVSACAPGEFEKQAAIVLGLSDLLIHAPQIVAEIVAALVGHIPLVGIVTGEEQRRDLLALLCDWGLPAHLMEFVFAPIRGPWVRDYGPSFVRWSDGSVAILDAQYPAPDRPDDDKLPSTLAALLKVSVAHVPLSLEGGNILSNGQGMCIASSAIIDRNEHRGYSERQIADLLSEYYGFWTGLLVAPLKRELTGHADMFATFTSPDVMLVGSYDPAIDPENAVRLDRNAEWLRGQRTLRGPLTVRRIPMPSNKDGVFRTYTNVVYANGRLLVPSYPSQDQELEKKAYAVYADVLPSWEIIPIDCEAMIKYCGALHCVTLNVPWLTDRFGASDWRYRPVGGSGRP